MRHWCLYAFMPRILPGSPHHALISKLFAVKGSIQLNKQLGSYYNFDNSVSQYHEVLPVQVASH